LQTYQKLLWTIIFAAFAARVAVRCYSGGEDFWVNGYAFFFNLAENIAAGKGFAFDNGPLSLLKMSLLKIQFGAIEGRDK
jgi:hypothetical protein